jgi:hypothetical protein
MNRHFPPREVMERGAETAGSICLDAGELDHLGPLLDFLADELAEVAGRERENRDARPRPDAEIVGGCRSKRASSFLICTRMLSNAALAARAARSASRAAASPKVHCHATSGSLPSPLGCLTNTSPAGRPIERRTAQALRRRSSTSAAKPGLAKYCVRSTIMVALVGIIVPCPSAGAGGMTGRAAAPAVRCGVIVCVSVTNRH